MSCSGHDTNCNCNASCQWTEELRDRCRNRCGAYGDPPCFELPNLTSDMPYKPAPCEACRRNDPVEE